MFGIGRKIRFLFTLVAGLSLSLGVYAQDESGTTDEGGDEQPAFQEVQNLPDCGDVPPKGGSGRLIVRTNPQKAVVYFGGTKVGLSPVDTNFSSGRYTLTIMLNGEELVTKRLNICPDQTTEFAKVLKLPYGTLVIRTTPIKINAKVWIDGEEVGSTKGGVLRINHIEAGTRSVKIKNGSKVKEVNVDVLAEESVDVDVKF
jgi:PEGA domain